ncbi:MAG: C-GCAxxG-C-C family protein [Euryarchaeota archaeon]|nr:C-GCAxxG-C-C family protein [Euryarchaeota archaeon]
MTSKEQLCDQAYQRAFSYEAKVGSCPQCVLAALKETLNIGDETLIKSADALAGGTSLSSKGTCGALAGGMLALGYLSGRQYSELIEGKKKRLIFRYTKILYDRFIEEYGSLLCCDVQKKLFGRSYNLLDKQEYEAFEKAGAHVDKCPSVAGNVARWTASIILEELSQKKGQ